MDLVLEGLAEAWRLVATGDAETFHALGVSLVCSLLAVGLAACAAVPYGTWLALRRPRFHWTQVFLLRVGMAVPTAFLGLLVYALLSRRGLLGGLDLLYTQAAIVLGQFLLAFPLVGALAHGAAAGLDPRVVETARTLGAGRGRTLLTALGEMRTALAAALLVAFARCVTELGIVLMVGGNIRMRTRTLPASMTVHVQQGEFGKALAPGVLLLVLAFGAAVAAHLLSRERRR